MKTSRIIQLILILGLFVAGVAFFASGSNPDTTTTIDAGPSLTP